ncbi:hypothetical protein D6V26_20330 [Vibrio cholerae]|nr:hypothetical protein [Vibrio cholerae]
MKLLIGLFNMENLETLTNVELLAFHERMNSNNSMFHIVFKHEVKDGIIHIYINKHDDSVFVIGARQEMFRGFFTDIYVNRSTIVELLRQVEETTGDMFTNNNRYRLPYPRLITDKVDGLQIYDEAFEFRFH